MNDLVEFLRERLDEDATEIARHPVDGSALTDPDWDLTATCEVNYPCSPYIEIGKDRALAEIDAKRRIIARHRPIARAGYQACAQCRIAWPESPNKLVGTLWPCPDLRDLAAVYASHPEYRDEWRPT